MKRYFYPLALLMIAGLLLAACGGATPEPAVEPTEPQATEPMEEPTEEEDEAQQIYLMGADGLLSDTHFENIGETGVGSFYSGPARPGGAAYEELAANYEDRFGEKPIQAFHAHAYDAATMVLKAIDAAAEEQDDGSLLISGQAVIEALYQMEHSGITGELRCNEFGDCAAPRIGIYRFTDPAQKASDVLSEMASVAEFDPPETGMGVVPEVPAGVEPREVVVPADAPIQLASLQAISGALANLGEDQNRGIELAIADHGPIAGHEVQLAQREDDLCSAEGGQTGAQRIIANPEIVAVIGTSCSGAAVPASDVLSAAGVPMFSASNTAPALTATGYLAEEGPSRGESWSYGYFRTAHNDEFQGRGAAAFAYNDLGVRRIATINDGDPYTQGLTSAMGGSFEEFGGEVVLATAVGKEQEDMRPVLTEVAASGAELVYFPIFEPAGNFIVLQIEDVGLEVIRD